MAFGETAVARRPGSAFVASIAGGVAVFAAPESPANKMIGVGFAGMPSDGDLARVEALFRERKAPLQAEVSTLADTAFATLLSRRGYVLEGFENVLGRPIVKADGELPPVSGFEIRLAEPADHETWLEVAITSFQHADEQGVPGQPLPPRETLEAVLREFVEVPGFQRYAAFVDGRMAGCASLRLDSGLAQLAGAATLPEFRRRGIQTAFLRRRLADALAAGCDLALITTSPGSKSQENAEKQGFALLYSRALLIKPGE
jgi:GNAT superfamily N-acetyltransferase